MGQSTPLPDRMFAFSQYSTSYAYFFSVDLICFIKLDGRDHQISLGKCIFVPAKADHRFHENKQDLVIFIVIFYALGGRS